MFTLNNKIAMAVAMPFVVASIVGGILVSTHRTAFPSLVPRPGLMPMSAPMQRATTCMNEDIPFSGIAISSKMVEHVTSFQRITQSHINIVEFYNPFPGSFDRWNALNAIQLHALPLIQLNPGKTDSAVLKHIAVGAYDKSIKSYAEAVKAFKYCVALSIGHEMNGWWYHWGLPWNKPTTFIRAWRHVHDVFVRAGVKNVIWSWDPSHQEKYLSPSKVATPASKWYPGNKYVDWIGIDGYLGKDHNGHSQSFTEIFSRQLANIRSVAPGKPLYIAETGVAPGPKENGQIASIFVGLRQNKMMGLIWFDQNRKQPWRLEGRPGAGLAYHQGVGHLARK